MKNKILVLAASALALVALIASPKDAKAKINMVYKDPPKSGVVAKIDGQEVTEDQLNGDSELELIRLQKQEYDIKISELQKIVTERLLTPEARDKIAKEDIKISDADYKKFVKEKNIPESNITDQIKERIYSYLKEEKRDQRIQSAVAKLTATHPVEVYFKKPRSHIQVVSGNAPSEGGENAKVTVTEFSDFQCPFCGRAAKTVTEIKKKYGSNVKIVFKQFPLPKEMHKNAMAAAEASMCVNEQGKDKFWKFHDLAFANQDKLDSENLTKTAKELGADAKKFQECFDSHKYADFVKKDVEYGEKLGVRSTPTFFVNGQLLTGAVPIETFSETIDEELASAK